MIFGTLGPTSRVVLRQMSAAPTSELRLRISRAFFDARKIVALFDEGRFMKRNRSDRDRDSHLRDMSIVLGKTTAVVSYKRVFVEAGTCGHAVVTRDTITHTRCATKDFVLASGRTCAVDHLYARWIVCTECRNPVGACIRGIGIRDAGVDGDWVCSCGNKPPVPELVVDTPVRVFVVTWFGNTSAIPERPLICCQGSLQWLV